MDTMCMHTGRVGSLSVSKRVRRGTNPANT